MSIYLNVLSYSMNKTNTDVGQRKLTICDLLRSTEREGVENLIDWMETSDYFEAPASASYHGNWVGGLAEHSYKIYEEFKRQVEHYNLNVPEESVIITSFLHDLCKVGLYKPNVMKSGEVSDKKPYVTNDTFPIGHGEKSVMMAQRHVTLTEQEMMIIRWHMGPYDEEYQKYAFKIKDLCPEAILFHHVDHEVSTFYGV